MSRWHSCNVFQAAAEPRAVWQFNARKDDFVPAGELKVPTGKPLPASVIARSLRTLWQKKLNVAWLPPEQVFLRVLHLPQASLAETRSMVELQLEKLSPLPVAQIAWSLHLLPHTPEQPQSIIVVIAPREQVEKFLGKLEGEGFLSDRLELPVVDQLASTRATGDGAWIYPGALGGADTALVAWWLGGSLQHLGLIGAPAVTNRAEALAAQLTQMAWAGEVEGWFKGSPDLNLVAGPEVAAEWEPVLRASLGLPVRVSPPQPVAELALSTARRAAVAPADIGLLPSDYATRYQQEFVDRLWMRGLFAVLGLYVAGTLIYFALVGGQYYRVNRQQSYVKALGNSYTNALQLEARFQVLKDRQDLKFAALDCWKATAELWPDGAVLQDLAFRDGKKLVLSGTASADQVLQLMEFNGKLRKYQVNGQPLFAKVEELISRKNPAGNDVSWSFTCELKQGESL
jgi:hypothetical protein